MTTLQRIALPTITQAAYASLIKEDPGNPCGEELDAKLSLFDPNGERAMPAIWYHDPKIYEAERRTVFKDWVAAGRRGDAEGHGSYFTVDIAEEPIVVLQDKDDLRALRNVCSHRATKLLTKPQGTLSDDVIKCRYHDWRYKFSGAIRSAPALGKLEGLSFKDLSLPSFNIETWGPLVFVQTKAEKDKGESLQTLLAPLIEQTAKINLSSWKWAARKEYVVNCNWKVYVDNFLDGGYHVKTIHPGLANALDLKRYRNEVFDRCSVQKAPVQDIADDPNAAVRKGSEDAMYWWIFPNTMVNIYNGAMDTNIVLPLGPDKCKVIFDFYFADGWDKLSIEKYINGVDGKGGADEVQLQDSEVCEAVQVGLRSLSYKAGPYAKPEISKHFHKLVASELNKINA